MVLQCSVKIRHFVVHIKLPFFKLSQVESFRNSFVHVASIVARIDFYVHVIYARYIRMTYCVEQGISFKPPFATSIIAAVILLL